MPNRQVGLGGTGGHQPAAPWGQKAGPLHGCSQIPRGGLGLRAAAAHAFEGSLGAALVGWFALAATALWGLRLPPFTDEEGGVQEAGAPAGRWPW